MKNKLFRQQATDSLKEAGVSDYMSVTGVSLYVLLAALLACVVAVGLWIANGSVNEFVRVDGIVFPHDGIVRSHIPHDGVVTEVYAERGSYVERGERLLRFTNQGVTAYVPASQAGILLSHKEENESFKAFESIVYIYPQSYAGRQFRQIKSYVTFKDLRKLSVGMEVQVSPADLPREEYGYIIGHITDISEYPVRRDDVAKYFDSEEIASAVLPEEAAYEIDVLVDLSPVNPEQLYWSNRVPENGDLQIGAFCNLQILTRKRAISDILFSR